MARPAYLFVALLVGAACAGAMMNDDDGSWLNRNARELLMAELGTDINTHVTTPCNASAVGSYAACHDSRITASNNLDYPFMQTEYTTYPTDGSPWGIHITGPYPDGVSYLISWYSGAPQTGTPDTLTNYTNDGTALVRYSNTTGAAASGMDVTGNITHYIRAYTAKSGQQAYSYLSPNINHAVLMNLAPATTYYYVVGDGTNWSEERNFTTLPTDPATIYPLRIGLIADVGQTENTSQTRDHLLANKPQVVIQVADLTYSDNYGANDPNNPNNSGNGTNQNRWDTYAVMWEPVFSSTPALNAAGNHEIESSGINAVINYTTTSFSYPTNYPFESYSARYPVPGTTSNWGNIDQNLWYSTTIAGKIKLITLCNYIPFHPGTPQWEWAMAEFAAVDRSATPWLFVQFHAPPYHTYVSHYKEMECFMSFWEDVFYHYGVDAIFNGHVHAYERTHPMYKYEIDQCGPIYITIGDGGNIEGPYRNFVDEINPYTNQSYCAGLVTNGLSPNQVQEQGATAWGPSYQRQAHPPGCTTTSWQPSYAVGAGLPLVPLNNTNGTTSDTPLGFCQSSQPLWSAYRDPSFGHGILDITSDTTMTMSWFRNIEGDAYPVDQVTLERLTSCAARQAAVPLPGSGSSTGASPAMTASPVGVTASPAAGTGASPVDTTTSPAATTGSPVDTTMSPVDTTTSPVATTGSPIDVTASPAAGTGPSPVDTIISPTMSTGSPVDTTMSPMDTTTSPVDTGMSPAATGRKLKAHRRLSRA